MVGFCVRGPHASGVRGVDVCWGAALVAVMSEEVSFEAMAILAVVRRIFVSGVGWSALHVDHEL